MVQRSGFLSPSVRFVRMGAVAPETLPRGELWVDVGGRAASGVLDHHGGDTEAWSATQLVLECFDDLVAPAIEDVEPIRFVTHESPDLDAICGIWLAHRLLAGGLSSEERIGLRTISRAVSENDQGFIRASSPDQSWPIVMRTLLEVEGRPRGDAGLVEIGFDAVDRTLKVVAGGGTLGDAASAVMTTQVRIVLEHARRDYLEDLGRATVFQVRLPVGRLNEGSRVIPDGPIAPPPKEEVRWSLADGLYLEEPASSLFKELARGDVENSPLGQGFALLMVSRRVDATRSRQERYRHVISTDPFTGLHLQGLGARLEEAERESEERSGEILLGRERLEPGEGRYGSGVPSPWYDGRGHRFTIVDSPSVVVDGRGFCGSLLTPPEVLEVLWRYGDPALHISAVEAAVTVLVPVDRAASLTSGWERRDPIGECRQDLLPESAAALAGLTVHAPLSPREAVCGRLRLENEELWTTADGSALWAGRFSSRSDDHLSFKELADAVTKLRSRCVGPLLPGGLAAKQDKDVHHSVLARVRPAEIAVEEREGASAVAITRLAFGDPSTFASREIMREGSSSARVFSRDRRVTAVACRFGVAVVSERPVSFESEADFHRPERLSVLVSVISLQKIALHDLWKQYVAHRTEGGPQAETFVLRDRERLFRLEQELLLPVLTSCGFGQRLTEALRAVFGICELSSEAQTQVQGLAQQVTGLRARFYQRLAFLVSVILAPLAITAGFFSGTHMQRRFAEVHYTFFPRTWQPAGWIQFGIVFGVLSVIVLVFWSIEYRSLRGSTLFKWLRRKKPE